MIAVIPYLIIIYIVEQVIIEFLSTYFKQNVFIKTGIGPNIEPWYIKLFL